ncbi:hypothetical protein EJ07DRAFT_169624 [Lizonia empirigonia]|nr:hypothetical protein EJ07DRAFT_169624 [Lizonia empirigonia]
MAFCLPEQPKPTVVAIDDVADRQEDATPPDGGYGWVSLSWDYAFIGGFNFSIAMLVAPLVTVLVRKVGTHRIMLAGALLQCSGFIAASFATRIWQLHLSQGILIGAGIGFLYIPSLPILSQWVSMIQRISIAWSLRITGIIAFVAIVAAVAVIRDRNHLLRRYDVLLLLAWAFTSMLGYVVLLFSLSDFALSIGFSRAASNGSHRVLELGHSDRTTLS